MDLDGKVAIVTGAGGRPNSIGEAYSLGLAAAGARVVCADLVKEGAEACADRVKAAGGTAIGLQVDISSEVSVNAMAQAVQHCEEAIGRETGKLASQQARHLRLVQSDSFSGLSLSAFNRIDGTQHGATIGILNIARELHGVQIGVLNIAYNKTTLPILPLVNFSR